MILVTGATGFMGVKLVDAMLARGESMRILVRDISQATQRLGKNATRVEIASGPVSSLDAVRAAMKNVDGVIHLAGIGAPASDESMMADILAVNTLGTANVMISAGSNNLNRVIFASSAAVYGKSATGKLSISEEQPLRPTSPYGVSKHSAEQLAEIYSIKSGIPTTALRFFNVYGPGQDLPGRDSFVIPSFMRKLGNGDEITLFGKGTQERDFVYVDDAVAAIASAYEAMVPGFTAINIGSGKGTSIASLVDLLASELGETPTIRMMPGRSGEVPRAVADVKKAKAVLGFEPKVAINDGIALTCQWSRMRIKESL